MMMTSRRSFLKVSACALAAFGGGCASFGPRRRKLALNASTLRGYALSLKDQVRAAVAAGFGGFEPWMKDIRAAKADGSFAEALALARDGGLRFVNGIAFGQWANPDAKIRAEGLEETKRDMADLAEMGCPCIAASLFGLQKPGSPHVTAAELAERFTAVCELGDRMGVKPLLEYWGHSVNMCRLEDALEVLAHVRRTDVAVLADVYHTYRGDGDFNTLARLKPSQLPILHVNDYPMLKPRRELVDADRVWPGDGAAPWGDILPTLDAAGLDPWLSIEVFNPDYWKSTPEATAREGFAKLLKTISI